MLFSFAIIALYLALVFSVFAGYEAMAAVFLLVIIAMAFFSSITTY